MSDGDGARGRAACKRGNRSVFADTIRRFDHLPAYLFFEGVRTMRGGGEFRRRGTTGRVTGAVQASVFVPKAVEEGRPLFDLSASA